ncbi:serine/arginine repetitive matrix protein 2 isoform X2 [Cimex lectularius]|uniref:Uncharacterized protein n=1 Tax=Cimex lectularius TaxID=79782 RepID=A0A8I6SKK0_CIMLE|nr:serine/arginine repetitive matrix protein 2 isoform X2 [Cimex lectularius]
MQQMSLLDSPIGLFKYIQFLHTKVSLSKMSSRKSTRDRSPKSRLRMDSYQNRNGRGKGSPRHREREIDSVMKKARSQRSGSQSTYWNKKLLEAEEKDPNRWRHSGYKELYHGEKRTSRSQSGTDSLSKSKSRSRSVSSGKSIVKSRLSPRHRPRSPRRDSRARSPQERNWSPRHRERGRLSYSSGRSPRDTRDSPRIDTRPKSPHRSPRRESVDRNVKSSRAHSSRRDSRGSMRSPERSRSPRGRRRSPIPRTPPKRPPSPRSKCRSESCSSDTSSSCSNESCSVCSPKRKGSNERDERDTKRPKSRDKNSLERNRHERLKNRPAVRSRSRSFSAQRSRIGKLARNRRKMIPDKSVLKVNRSHYIKVESDSDSSSRESVSAVGVVANGPRISLSERFGRMAQWSVDRDLELRNLRITADRDRLTVEMDNPPSPLYPPSLSSLTDLGSWDDVRVRYTYYKEHGYLRDLTLQDYIKWEQWWYKYQDWLDSDRYNYYRRRL